MISGSAKAWGRKGAWLSVLAGVALLAVAVAHQTFAEGASSSAVPASATASPRATSALMLSVAVAGKRLVGVGERGLVLLSDDGGNTWSRVDAPATSTLAAVSFSDDRNGWIVGHDALILRTGDGGLTWERQLDATGAAKRVAAEAGKLGTDQSTRQASLEDARQLAAGEADRPLFAVAVDSTGRGFAVGAFGLAFATTDGGSTWESIASRLPNPKGKHLYGVLQHGASVWIIGEQGGLFRSLDNGSTFSEVAIPYSGTLLGGIAFDSNGLLVYGLRGNVWRTDDGGLHWSKVASPQMNTTVTNGRTLSDGRIALVDQSGQVLLSADRGVTFKPSDLRAKSPINSFVQADKGHLVLATVRGFERIPLGQSDSSKQ